MTVIESIAKEIIDNGGIFYKLEDDNGLRLCMTKTKYSDGRDFFYNSPMYQIFDKEGNRIFVTVSLDMAYKKYDDLKDGGE